MKKLHGIWMTVFTVILSVMMLMGTMTLSAFADTVTGTTIDDVTYYKTIEYGKTLNTYFDKATQIIAPNGAEVQKTDKADQLGVYTVYYGTYSYTVSCKLDKEYELRVAHNGADIPTYAHTGKTIKLPTAAVWYEEDGVMKKDDTQAEYVKVSVIGLSTFEDKVANTEYEVALTEAKTYTVRYYAKIGGGNKYLYKDYTVKVQDGFEDTTIPTLNAVIIPENISLNTKVTLPKATATDNYDTNVKVEISVKMVTESGEEDVYEYELDKNGYVKYDENGQPITVKDKEGNPVKVTFENDYNLSFYPVKKTNYKIKYTAVDDYDNKATTSNREYTAKATDRTAPVLESIDDELIPTKWGTSVTNEKKETVSTTITFPYPNYVDNSGETPSVKFELKDTTNKQTVLSIANINAKANENGELPTDAKYSYNANDKTKGLYNDEANPTLSFTKAGLTIDLANYNPGDGKSKTGTYTVTYQARDSVPNIVTKTYDITLENTLNDTAAPDVKVTYNDKYLLFTNSEEEYTIPKAVVSDDVDTRPSVVYTLSNGTTEITVEGGEVAVLTIADNTPTLYINKGETDQKSLALTDELHYKVVATDDAKNVGTAEGSLAVVNADTLQLSKISYSAAINGAEIEEGEPQAELGGFEFAVDKDLWNFYGYEISLTKGGELWTGSAIWLDTYYDGAKVVVKNIMASVPTLEDGEELHLCVRIFNVAGESEVHEYQINVVPTEKPNDDPFYSAANIATTGSVYTTYTLKNTNVPAPADCSASKRYIVRSIEGKGKFSLMGAQFTTYTAGTFTFHDSYYNKSDDLVPYGKQPTYHLDATESETPVWNIQGDVPAYVAKGDTVVLPAVVASTSYANAKIEVTVTCDKDTVNKDNGRLTYVDDHYEFDAEKDAVYTVTVKASYGDNGSISQTFAIKAGDIVAPTFTVVDLPGKVNGTSANRALENDVFRFSSITLKSQADLDTASAVHYKKTLKAPDGSEVYTVDSTGETARTREVSEGTDGYTFTKTGTYTVVYTVTDENGNSSITTGTISVTAAKVNNPINTKIISTILIIVGVLLIAGVILYFVRFRKVKAK